MERIESKDQLISYIAGGEKDPSDFKIGTEHEKFPFNINKNKPISYDGKNGIRRLLENFEEYGWKQVYENGNWHDPSKAKLQTQFIYLGYSW